VGVIVENPGEICYFVHWKGYEEEENSWTTEGNSSGAQELINEFWKNRKRLAKPSRQDLLDAYEAKNSRKSKKRSSLATPAKKPRAPEVADASSEDLGEIISKTPFAKSDAKSKTTTPIPTHSAKRRRSSVTKSHAMEVDEDETRDEDAPVTKKRKSGVDANGQSASKKHKDVAPPPSVSTDLIADTMTRYGQQKNWEAIVKNITTVEKREDGHQLQIFWTSVDGIDCLTPSKVFSKKCPQKLIQFYESNLKWRPHDSPEEVPNDTGATDAMQE